MMIKNPDPTEHTLFVYNCSDYEDFQQIPIDKPKTTM